jgi:hypothetical protein
MEKHSSKFCLLSSVNFSSVHLSLAALEYNLTARVSESILCPKLPILFAESYPLEDWLELVSSLLEQAKSLYLIFLATKQQRPAAHIRVI